MEANQSIGQAVGGIMRLAAMVQIVGVYRVMAAINDGHLQVSIYPHDSHLTQPLFIRSIELRGCTATRLAMQSTAMNLVKYLPKMEKVS